MDIEKKMRGIITKNPELYKEAIEYSQKAGEPFTLAFIDIAASNLVALLDRMNEASKDDPKDFTKINALIYHLSVFTALHVRNCKERGMYE